jgi:hypothetical protein
VRIDLFAMDQDVGQINTPRSNARRNEREGRTLDTPERRRIPGLQLPAPPQPFELAVPAPLPGPVQHDDPFQINYVPAPGPAHPVYQHLPANLAQAVAQLPPLQPIRRGRGRPRNNQQTAVTHTANPQTVGRRGRPRQIAENANHILMQPPEPVPAVSLYFLAVYIVFFI